MLDAFVRALPHTYRDLYAADGATVLLTIDGDAGGAWTLRREQDGWRLYHGTYETPEATIHTDPDTAWRLFTKGITADQARARSRTAGDPQLVDTFFTIVSISA